MCHGMFTTFTYICQQFYLNIAFYLLLDDNECELGTHMCHEFATCSNKLGGYDCECDDGYHGDGFSCTGKHKY